MTGAAYVHVSPDISSQSPEPLSRVPLWPLISGSFPGIVFLGCSKPQALVEALVGSDTLYRTCQETLSLQGPFVATMVQAYHLEYRLKAGISEQPQQTGGSNGLLRFHDGMHV